MSRLARATLAVSLLLAPVARAEVSPKQQAVILTRALAYDDKLKERAGDTVVVAVLYRSGNSTSESESTAIFEGFEQLAKVRVQGLPFKVVRIAWSGVAALKTAIGSQGIDAIYVCNGLSGEIGAIKEATRKLHILTLAASEEDVRNGLSMGVFTVEGKSTITVNLTASREEGAAMGSGLLSLAKVIR